MWHVLVCLHNAPHYLSVASAYAITGSLFNMARSKRRARQQRAAAAAAAAQAAPLPSPLAQLAVAVTRASLSYRPPEEVKSDESAADSAEEADPDADPDSQPPAPKRRKRNGKNNKPLTEQQRLECLRMNIDGQSAASIAAVFKARGITIPLGTLYTLFSKQTHGLPITPQPRHRRTKYTDEDKVLIVQAQNDHNDWRYEDLRKAWKEANPEKAGAPSNDTIHKWLHEADITSKTLVPVPVARNQPANIQARKEYSLRAMTWERDRLIFIDETTFSKGLHSRRGRSKRGSLATYTALNSGGVGMKVCAAVSPTLGLVMFETQLVAYSGADFARFMTRLCSNPLVQRKSMIMVMDNVALHFTEEVKDAMAGQAIQHDIERLPVYSPHLNPIEYCFHNWKNEIKHVDQLHDRRTLQQQIEDTRTVVTDHLVTRILEHVYQLYSHCIQGLPLEEFKSIGHRVARAQEEAALQRAVIAAGAQEEKE